MLGLLLCLILCLLMYLLLVCMMLGLLELFLAHHDGFDQGVASSVRAERLAWRPDSGMWDTPSGPQEGRVSIL